MEQADRPDHVIDIDGRSIAVRQIPGAAPGIVWLGGWRSDMRGTKAEAIAAFAAAEGRSYVRHDYSGHGESGGDWRDGTISRWVAESLAVFRRFTGGPQIVVGSSMGAWIALRLCEELRKAGDAGRVAALILLAPAPDFTMELIESALTEQQRADLDAKGWFEEASDYGMEPNIWSRAFLDDGRANRVLKGIIRTGCPVRIIQGLQDTDVPHRHALKLMEHLPADDVTLTLVRDGDHRLSRPQDIDLMLRTLRQAIGAAEAKR